MDVAQSPPALSLQEGASSTLQCNFSTFADNVQWYLQNPRGPPHPPVLRSFRDKAEWKIKRHDSPYRTPQLPAHFLFADHRLGHLLLCCAAQCSPGTCSLYSNPPRGSAPPPATVTPGGHHRAFSVLNVTHLYQDSFNHRHFLALQIMDFGLYLSFSTCISFCTRNF